MFIELEKLDELTYEIALYTDKGECIRTFKQDILTSKKLIDDLIKVENQVSIEFGQVLKFELFTGSLRFINE